MVAVYAAQPGTSPSRPARSGPPRDLAGLEAADQPVAPVEVIAFVADAEHQGRVAAEVRRVDSGRAAGVAGVDARPDRLVLRELAGVGVGLAADHGHRRGGVGEPDRVDLE